MSAAETSVDQQTVDQIIRDWPNEPTEIVERMIDRYGFPDEAAPSELLWYGNGPWKRTEMYRDGVPHNFPKQHTDYLKQVIDYHVPSEKLDDLGQFDGSVYVDRTNGELASKCDKEPMNVLALNLAHDIVTDEVSVDDARQEYAVTALKQMMGGSPGYTEALQFPLAEEKQRDPDESIVTDAMREEVKDMVEGATEADKE